MTGETCPQYLVLTAADMDRPGREGAKFMCSPSPREAGDAEGLWAAIRAGTLDVISSDHCGYSFLGDRGKWLNGADSDFTRIPNGIPGLAARLAIIFSEGVAKGRIDVNHFVRLTATPRPSVSAFIQERVRSRRAPTPTWCCGTQRGACGSPMR